MSNGFVQRGGWCAGGDRPYGLHLQDFPGQGEARPDELLSVGE